MLRAIGYSCSEHRRVGSVADKVRTTKRNKDENVVVDIMMR